MKTRIIPSHELRAAPGSERGAPSTQRPVLPSGVGQDSVGWRRRHVPHREESMSHGPEWRTGTAVSQCGSGDTGVISCGGERSF